MIHWCPEGAMYQPAYQLCMTNQYAIGPFTPQMKTDCENYRGSRSPECAGENWDIYFAGVLRGAGRCPAGSQFSAQWSACVDTEYAYGPFSNEQVDRCRTLQWAHVCETMRWPLGVLQGRKAPPAPAPNISSEPQISSSSGPFTGIAGRLLNYYGNAGNYRSVHAQVMDWFGTSQNACVAFISTALRNIGVPVPRRLNTRGYNISTWTAAFSDYLESDLGWQRITRLSQLNAGDVVFTLDFDGTAGTPAHVFLFAGWIDDSSARARVIDNQGFLHTRDLLGTHGNFTPFSYALRPRG